VNAVHAGLVACWCHDCPVATVLRSAQALPLAVGFDDNLGVVQFSVAVSLGCDSDGHCVLPLCVLCVVCLPLYIPYRPKYTPIASNSRIFPKVVVSRCYVRGYVRAVPRRPNPLSVKELRRLLAVPAGKEDVQQQQRPDKPEDDVDESHCAIPLSVRYGNVKQRRRRNANQCIH